MSRGSAFIFFSRVMCLFVFPYHTARGDIYQWEYVGPADLLRRQPSSTLAPDGQGLVPGPGMDAAGKDLTMAWLRNVDLTAAAFDGGTLSGADLLPDQPYQRPIQWRQAWRGPTFPAQKFAEPISPTPT